jgi:hypothetical protein
MKKAPPKEIAIRSSAAEYLTFVAAMSDKKYDKADGFE